MKSDKQDNEITLDPTIPPESLLAIMINDLRKSLSNIEGWASILETDITEEELTQAREGILGSVQGIRKAFDATGVYLVKRRQLDDAQNDTDSF